MKPMTVLHRLTLPDGKPDDTLRRGTTIVDFITTWSAPCRFQQTIIEQLAVLFQGKARFLTLDVDEHPKSAMHMGITSIPTLIIYKDGEEIQRFVGLQSSETLSEAIDKIFVKPGRRKR